MKTKFLEKLNALVYTFVGFTTFFLLGCPAMINSAGTGVKTFFDAFGLFAYGTYCVRYNIGYGRKVISSSGALVAAGVFNVFILIFAIVLFAIGIFTLLKKASLFDWKLDDKIEKFDVVSKIVLSIFTGFAFLSVLCVSVFIRKNINMINLGVGGGLIAILLFGILACLVVWLLPVIQVAMEKKKAKSSNVASKKDESVKTDINQKEDKTVDDKIEEKNIKTKSPKAETTKKLEAEQEKTEAKEETQEFAEKQERPVNSEKVVKVEDKGAKTAKAETTKTKETKPAKGETTEIKAKKPVATETKEPKPAKVEKTETKEVKPIKTVKTEKSEKAE